MVSEIADGKKVILPAKQYALCRNVENPELYSIFPYRKFGVGKDNLELAQDTFDARRIKEQDCWHQDDIQSAYLGRADETFEYIYQRTKGIDENSKFPGVWAMYNDWIHDMDHGGVLMMALQASILQSDVESNEIHILPAFPNNLDVDFRLYADKHTIVEGSYKGGKFQSLTAIPASRAKDIVFE